MTCRNTAVRRKSHWLAETDRKSKDINKQLNNTNHKPYLTGNPKITRWELSCQIGYLYIPKWDDGKINKIIKWHHENMITDGVIPSRHNEI